METISDDMLEKSKPVGFVTPVKPEAQPNFEEAVRAASSDGTDPSNEKEEPKPKKVNIEGGDDEEELDEKELDDLLDKANAAMSEVVDEIKGESGEGAEPEPVKVDVDKAVESSPIMSAASERVEEKLTDKFHMNDAERTMYEAVSEITDDDKNAFIAAITTGDRYKVSTSLFGGRVPLVLRSRSTGESEAIDSYVRRGLSSGSIANGSEYGDAMRLCLLVASVERLGEETYPEMQEPLLPLVKGKGDVKEPGWVHMLDVWRSKPEGLVNAVLKRLFAFEAKYSEMVARSLDENFWKPGESTGE